MVFFPKTVKLDNVTAEGDNQSLNPFQWSGSWLYRENLQLPPNCFNSGQILRAKFPVFFYYGNQGIYWLTEIEHSINIPYKYSLQFKQNGIVIWYGQIALSSGAEFQEFWRQNQFKRS